MTNHALINDIVTRTNKAVANAQRDIKHLRAFPVLAKTCWASDSGKPVIQCSCPQCRETRAIVRKTDALPHWCIPA